MQSAVRHGKARQEEKRIRRRGGKAMSWSVSLVVLVLVLKMQACFTLVCRWNVKKEMVIRWR